MRENETEPAQVGLGSEKGGNPENILKQDADNSADLAREIQKIREQIEADAAPLHEAEQLTDWQKLVAISKKHDADRAVIKAAFAAVDAAYEARAERHRRAPRVRRKQRRGKR